MDDVSRRRLVAGSIAAGFAAGFARAVRPIAAETVIATDAAGLDAGMIEIPAGDRAIPAYRAQPAGGRNLPTIIVIHEVFALHEHIRDVCRRLAKAGYLALAPDLYVRQGDVQGLPSIDAVIGIVRQVPDLQVLNDLDATAAWAVTHTGATDQLAVTGFCWGGRQSWLYAAHNPRLKAAAAWYGQLAGQGNPLRPVNPVDLAASLVVPVLGLYGGQDEGIPPTDIEAMGQALGTASRSRIEVFADAPHGFNADYRPSYRAADATRAWGMMLAWFRHNGVGSTN